MGGVSQTGSTGTIIAYDSGVLTKFELVFGDKHGIDARGGHSTPSKEEAHEGADSSVRQSTGISMGLKPTC